MSELTKPEGLDDTAPIYHWVNYWVVHGLKGRCQAMEQLIQFESSLSAVLIYATQVYQHRLTEEQEEHFVRTASDYDVLTYYKFFMDGMQWPELELYLEGTRHYRSEAEAYQLLDAYYYKHCGSLSESNRKVEV